jgi:hypothetical protein
MTLNLCWSIPAQDEDITVRTYIDYCSSSFSTTITAEDELGTMLRAYPILLVHGSPSTSTSTSTSISTRTTTSSSTSTSTSTISVTIESGGFEEAGEGEEQNADGGSQTRTIALATAIPLGAIILATGVWLFFFMRRRHRRLRAKEEQKLDITPYSEGGNENDTFRKPELEGNVDIVALTAPQNEEPVLSHAGPAHRAPQPEQTSETSRMSSPTAASTISYSIPRRQAPNTSSSREEGPRQETVSSGNAPEEEVFRAQDAHRFDMSSPNASTAQGQYQNRPQSTNSGDLDNTGQRASVLASLRANQTALQRQLTEQKELIEFLERGGQS